MIVGMILLAGTYPYFGYTKRSIEGNIVTDREQINRAADFTNLVLVAETENELIYHAKGLRRLAMLFEEGNSIGDATMSLLYRSLISITCKTH
jgi:hypothetical protein